MSTPGQAASDAIHCGECGAENLGANERCWLCYRPLVIIASLAPNSPAKSPPVTPANRGNPALWTTAIMAIVLLTMVGVGAFASDFNVGVVYCVVMTPALVAGLITFAITTHRQSAATGTHTPGQLSRTPVAAGLRAFFASLAVTVATLVVAAAVMVLVVVAAVIALVATCFSALGMR